MLFDPPRALEPDRRAAARAFEGLRARVASPRSALAAFVAVDLLFVSVFAVHDILSSLLWNDREMAVENLRWHIGDDASYAEMFGYAKLAAAAVLLAVAWRRTRASVHLVFAGAFAVLLLDDTQRVHERVSLAIAGGYGDAWELAQLAVGSGLGLSVVAACVAAVARARGEARRRGLALLGTLLAIGFCGVIVDYLHIRLRGSFSGAHALFTLVEEGGEQLFISLAAALAISAALGRRLLERTGART